MFPGWEKQKRVVLGDGVEILYKSPLSQVFIFLVLDELLGTQETRVKCAAITCCWNGIINSCTFVL